MFSNFAQTFALNHKLKKEINNMKTIENVVKECKKLSFGQKNAFPEVLKKLTEVGIQRYYADLVRLENTYYGKGLVTYRDQLPLDGAKDIEEDFSQEGIRNAIASSQRGEIDFPTFLHQAMKSGIVSYTVFINGAQVHYCGRKGDVWVEKFPVSK